MYTTDRTRILVILQNYTLQTSPFKYNGRFTWSRSMCLAWSKTSASHIILPSVTGGLFWVSGGKIREQYLDLWMSRRQIRCLWCMHAVCVRHKLLLVLVCCQNPVPWASPAKRHHRATYQPQATALLSSSLGLSPRGEDHVDWKMVADPSVLAT